MPAFMYVAFLKFSFPGMESLDWVWEIATEMQAVATCLQLHVVYNHILRLEGFTVSKGAIKSKEERKDINKSVRLREINKQKKTPERHHLKKLDS